MQLDPAAYLHHLNGFDLNEDQKLDIVHSVALIMQSFVDLAFGTDSTQISLGIGRAGRTLPGPDTVDFKDQFASTFNDAVLGRIAGKTTP